MEQTVRVRRLLENGNAEVVHVRESACSGDCHKCSGCGAAKEAVIFTARNLIGARPGELVRVESSTAPVLKAAVVLYVLPSSWVTIWEPCREASAPWGAAWALCWGWSS